jgi:hypothetical protein
MQELGSMAEEWIEKLAADIKQKNREAAEDYGRSQHYAGIISDLGKGFFVAFADCLTKDVELLRRALQGDPTAAETGVQTIKANEIKITRARFPWVDARVTHKDDTITLEYAKGPGSGGDPALNRNTRIYAFRVGADDSLYVEDAFADQPGRYEKPEDLARQMAEFLFAA